MSLKKVFDALSNSEPEAGHPDWSAFVEDNKAEIFDMILTGDSTQLESLVGDLSPSTPVSEIKESAKAKPQAIVVNALPSSPDPLTACYHERPDGLMDLWVSDANGVLHPVQVHPVIYSDRSIKVHRGSANEISELLSTTIVFPYDGDYVMNLSFNYNADSVSTDGVVYAAIDGRALDLNDRIEDPEGNTQILRVELKESGDSSAGAITGSGSGVKLSYSMPFDITETAGAKDLVISASNEGSGVETSIWNFKASLQFIG